MPTALLVLADGTHFVGNAIGASGQAVGEVIFNTGVFGYQETLTDPASSGQIVSFVYTHIGNYGITSEDDESAKVCASGVVIRDLPLIESNYRSQGNLQDWLRRNGTVAIAHIDTRQLTRHIREHGEQMACIVAFDKPTEITQKHIDEAVAAAKTAPASATRDLVSEATCKAAYTWNGGAWTLAGGYQSAPAQQPYHVVVLDVGARQSLLRALVQRGCKVTVVPAQTALADIVKLQPDGVVVSSGPGNPQACAYAMDTVRSLIDKKAPLFGVGLGFQLLALASGAKTSKRKVGNHGANVPVKDLDTGSVVITSQNHGYAVDAGSLPANLRATHISLFDDSPQGVQRTDAPAFGVQWFPGGHQLDQFTQMMRNAKHTEKVQA